VELAVGQIQSAALSSISVNKTSALENNKGSISLKDPKILAQQPTNSIWKFEVDYNDHFETPKKAYEDLTYILDILAAEQGRGRSTVTLYDPYYCQGNMLNYLHQLSFPNVINENKDFYQGIQLKTIPGMSTAPPMRRLFVL
jgi:hypothetical protein